MEARIRRHDFFAPIWLLFRAGPLAPWLQPGE